MLLFVGNLAFWATDIHMRSIFEPFGPVISASIVVDEHGRPRGFGIVAFVEDAHARAAIAALDGQCVNGRIMQVRVADARQIIDSRLVGGNIGNLSPSMDPANPSAHSSVDGISSMEQPSDADQKRKRQSREP